MRFRLILFTCLTFSCMYLNAARLLSLEIQATINFSLSKTDPSTCGSSDGSIFLNGLSPNTSYDVLYQDGQGTVGPFTVVSDASGQAVISGLSAGTYSNITVINGPDSGIQGPITLVGGSSSPPLVSDFDERCAGECNGGIRIELAVTDLVTFSIDDGSNVFTIGPVLSDTAYFDDLCPGSYTVSVLGTSCTYPTSQVSIQPAPQISFDPAQTYAIDSDCMMLGGNGVVSAGATGGWYDQFIYDWYKLPDTTTLVSTQPTWGNRPGGDYLVVVTEDSTGCQIDTVLTVITIMPQASFTIDSVIGTQGSYTPYLSNTSSASSNWKWIVDGATYLVTTDFSASPDTTFADSIEVCLVAFNNFACSDTTCQWVSASSQGPASVNARTLEFRVYPNPVSGPLHVILPEGSAWELTLLDGSGRVALILPSTSGETILDIGAVTPGIYTLVMRNSVGSMYCRILRQ